MRRKLRDVQRLDEYPKIRRDKMFNYAVEYSETNPNVPRVFDTCNEVLHVVVLQRT